MEDWAEPLASPCCFRDGYCRKELKCLPMGCALLSDGKAFARIGHLDGLLIFLTDPIFYSPF